MIDSSGNVVRNTLCRKREARGFLANPIITAIRVRVFENTGYAYRITFDGTQSAQFKLRFPVGPTTQFPYRTVGGLKTGGLLHLRYHAIDSSRHLGGHSKNAEHLCSGQELKRCWCYPNLRTGSSLQAGCFDYCPVSIRLSRMFNSYLHHRLLRKSTPRLA